MSKVCSDRPSGHNLFTHDPKPTVFTRGKTMLSRKTCSQRSFITAVLLLTIAHFLPVPRSQPKNSSGSTLRN